MSTPRSAAPTKRTASLAVLFSGFPSGVSLVTVAVSLISTCSVAVSDTRIVVRPPAGSEPRVQGIVPSASAQAPSTGGLKGADVMGKGPLPTLARSEERRVGEEGRSRWSPYHLKEKKKN